MTAVLTDPAEALTERVAALEHEKAEADRRLRSELAAAARAGMSQRAIAARVCKSQPEVHRLITRSSARCADGSPRGWMTARDAADAATRAARAGDELEAFKMIVQALDHLGRLADPDDIAEWAVTPPPIPHPGLDTLLQALTRRAFTARGLPVPDWAARPRPLKAEWVLAALPSRAARVKAATPTWLAKLGIFVSDRDLVTA